MWIDKDGKPFSGNSVVVDGYRFFNPDSDMMQRAGYTWFEPPPPASTPKKYSKYKIILALGEDWPTYKAQIESAGLYDLFSNAEYLEEGDPLFDAFMENVPEELKAKLDECLWEY